MLKPELLPVSHPIDSASADLNGPKFHIAETRTIWIEPPHRWEALELREVWRYRELLYFLIWRDMKVRYKQTAIGAAWVILQPLLTMVVFSVIFGSLIRVPSDGVPYPIFSYAALLPWNFFAAALNRSSNSLIYDTNLISKVYFPRLILPLSAVVSMTVDFVIAFVILLAMMFFYGIVPGIAVLSLPVFLFLALMTALACGLWLSALNVKYRDIAYVIPFLTQFWFFITPVAYPSSIIPEAWTALYGLNPMAGVIEGFRWALLGTTRPPGALIFISTAVVVTVLLAGVFYFRHMENEFADVV